MPAASLNDFGRIDEADDGLFYTVPRLVIHVDENASAILTTYFEKSLPVDGDIIDLMSSYRSHLPKHNAYKSVVGLGMNQVELQHNSCLTDHLTHDLNKQPKLPYQDNQFDACLVSFSIQYLLQPVVLMADVGRILRPGGICHVAFSNRMFPTKAVAVWHAASDLQKAELISHYFDASNMFDVPELEQLVAPGKGFDPLYVIRASCMIDRVNMDNSV